MVVDELSVAITKMAIRSTPSRRKNVRRILLGARNTTNQKPRGYDHFTTYWNYGTKDDALREEGQQ